MEGAVLPASGQGIQDEATFSSGHHHQTLTDQLGQRSNRHFARGFEALIEHEGTFGFDVKENASPLGE